MSSQRFATHFSKDDMSPQYPCFNSLILSKMKLRGNTERLQDGTLVTVMLSPKDHERLAEAVALIRDVIGHLDVAPALTALGQAIIDVTVGEHYADPERKYDTLANGNRPMEP